MRGLLTLVVSMGVGLSLAGAAVAADLAFDWHCNSVSAVDSSRKEYAVITYPLATALTPVGVPQTYDKTFVTNVSDLHFEMRGDLSSRQILDVKEYFHYQGHRPEDFAAFNDHTYKYQYLDHLLAVTYGNSLSSRDNLQLDYHHAIYEIPIDQTWNHRYHLGGAQFTHRIGDRHTFWFGASHEQREYPNDPNEDYRESIGAMEYTLYWPQRLRYELVANSTRGDDRPFRSVGSGYDAKKPIKWYTDWTRKPGHDNPDAKYLAEVQRGDLFLTLRGEYRDRERSRIDNGWGQGTLGLRAQYDQSERTRFRLESNFDRRRHEAESDAFSLYDFDHQRSIFSSTYLANADLTTILTFGYETYDHVRRIEFNHDLLDVVLEAYYRLGRADLGLFGKGEATRYGQSRAFYPDSNRRQFIIDYRYPFSHSCSFRLKDEWVDHDYDVNENEFYSSYVANIYRLSVVQALSDHHSLEASYQERRETHERFTMNNITEKTLMFSWYSAY